MKSVISLFVLLTASTALFSQAPDATYLWPTNSGTFLSATFGETRSSHYHAGLDIKTWGVEGYKVFASRDGILSRLTITNTGYGKVIYLKHNDGTYTVYAHLSKFNPQFQSLADSLRLDRFAYEMDGEFEADSFFVKQGDVIGYTGSTGIGPPHHHFEIRNADNEPINPLLSNLIIKDTIAPSFIELMVEPLTPQTSIAGSNIPKTYKPAIKSKNNYDFGKIPVSGKIGLAANIIDRADDVFNRYMVYELTLKEEDQIIFSQRISSFNFNQAKSMPLDRVPAPGKKSRDFIRMYVKEAANHPFVLDYTDYGYIKYNTSYTIIAKDYFGNTSQAEVQFVPETESHFEKKNASVNDFKNAYWNKDWVVFADDDYLDLRNYNAGVLWDTATGQQIIDFREDINTTVTRILPNRATKVVTPNSKLSLYFPADTFFDTASVLQSYTYTDDTLEIEILPETLTLRKNYEIKAFLGDLFEDYSKARLYTYDPATKRMFYINSAVEGKTLWAETSRLGIFRVAQDTVPPVIKKPFIRKLGTGEHAISLRTDDNLSGVDFKTAVMTVNGRRGIAEYDYEKKQFTFYLPGFRLQRNNSVHFSIKDRAGNIAEATFRL